jgi:hypothetical protein
MCIGVEKSPLFDDGEHPRWRVRECPEFLSPQPEEQILRAQQETGQHVARWIAEHQQTACMVNCCAEKPLVVRVTTHDSVEDDNIGRLDAFRIGCDVVKAPLGASFNAGIAYEPHRLLVVPRRQLEVQGVSRATLQQLDLHFTDSAADLEDRRALDPLSLEKGQDAPRRLASHLSRMRTHATTSTSAGRWSWST